MLLTLSLSFRIAELSVLSLEKLSDREETLMEKSIQRKKLDSDNMLIYKIEKGPLVEKNLVAVPDVLLLPWTKAYELASPGCGVWWSTKSPNLQLLSWETFPMLVEVRIDCFHCLFWNGGPPSNSSVFTFRRLFESSTHLRLGGYKTWLLVSKLKVPPNHC